MWGGKGKRRDDTSTIEDLGLFVAEIKNKRIFCLIFSKRTKARARGRKGRARKRNWRRDSR